MCGRAGLAPLNVLCGGWKQLYGDACALLRRYWYRLGTRRYVQELFERTPLTAAYITDPTPTAPSPALVRPPRLHTNTHICMYMHRCSSCPR
jgi:hypothetical protein